LFFHCGELLLTLIEKRSKTAHLKDTTTAQAMHLFSRDLSSYISWYNGIFTYKAAQICAILL